MIDFVMKNFLPIGIGALAGFGYYKFIGCASGACPITSNPVISTIYGAGMGYLVSSLWK
jgi:hypothetical protein